MDIQKEKARFAFEILKRFAPYMDHCNEQQERMESLADLVEPLAASLRSADDNQRAVFSSFVDAFSTYMDEQELLHAELKAAYGYLSEQTVTLVTNIGKAKG